MGETKTLFGFPVIVRDDIPPETFQFGYLNCSETLRMSANLSESFNPRVGQVVQIFGRSYEVLAVDHENCKLKLSEVHEESDISIKSIPADFTAYKK